MPRSFWNFIPKALAALLGGLLAVILCLLVCFQSHYNAYIGQPGLLSALPLMGLVTVTLAAGLGLYALYAVKRPATALKQRPTSRRLWLLCAAYLPLLLAQCVMARSLWFYVGFDASNVRAYSAALALGQPVDGGYFRLCPNNAPLTVLLAIPYWLGAKLGLAEPYVMEVYASVLFVNLSCLLCMLCVCRLTKRRGARWFAFGLSSLLLLFSPYITMPYTDTFALLFPILSFWFLLSGLNAPARYGLAALSASFGAAIKPSALIVLIAVLLLAVCRALSRLPWARADWKRGIITLAAVAIGFLPGWLFQNASITLLAGSPKPEETLDTAHYLMIGLDDQYWGGHSVEGLNYSQSFSTRKERNAANVRAALDHLGDRSLLENVHFFSVKAYKAYADGTFAWNGSALMDAVPRRTDTLSVFLRSIFYRQGDLNPLYGSIAQGLWLMTLLLASVAALWRRGDYPVQLLSLTLLGLTGYQLLFEVWPRYLFLYAPFFILLGALGLERLCLSIQALVSHKLAHATIV